MISARRNACETGRRFSVGLGLAAAALAAWYIPYGLPTPDAGGFLTQGARIADGAVFYRDLDAYPFPAAPYLLAIVFKLFGKGVLVARVLSGVVFVVITLVSYAITLRLAAR